MPDVEHILSAVDARLAAILFAGRGADGTLGATAQARAIPADQLRRLRAPLLDPGTSLAVFSRGVHLTWRAGAQTSPGARNARDPYVLEEYRLVLQVGYLGGEATPASDASYPAPGASNETATGLALDPRLYALSDARRIRAALETPELYQSGADAVAIIDVQQEAEADVSDALAPRYVLTQQFLVRLWAPSTPTP